MNDERFLKDWLKGSTDSSAGPDAAADKVVARLPEVKQRSRWWPLRPGRRSSPETTARTRLMLNPVSAVVAGLLTIATSVAILVSVPLGQDTAVVPAAETETERVQLLGFTSTYRFDRQPNVGTTELLPNGVSRTTDSVWGFVPIEASDPRLNGTLTFTNNLHRYPPEELRPIMEWPEILMGAARIQTDEGAWQEVPQVSYNRDRQPGDTVDRAFVGEGAYEGLIAVATDTWQPPEMRNVGVLLEGIIVEGELPDDPVPWTPED
jgi:hypothetical protein